MSHQLDLIIAESSTTCFSMTKSLCAVLCGCLLPVFWMRLRKELFPQSEGCYLHGERQREVRYGATVEVKYFLSLSVPALYKCFMLLCSTLLNSCHRASSPCNDTMIPSDSGKKGGLTSWVDRTVSLASEPLRSS